MNSASAALLRLRRLSVLAVTFAGLAGVACSDSEGQSSGGSGGSGGASSGTGGTAGATASGGSSGGTQSKGGSGGSGGSGMGGTSSAGTGNGGTSSAGTSNGGSGGGSVTACGGKSISLNLNPFGCEMAWGNNADPENERQQLASYMSFVSSWVLETEPGLAEDIAGTDAIPVYYGYIIGDTGHDAGLPDCNLGGPPNLCTHGAQMIRDNWDTIVAKYRAAAQASNAANNGKIAVWLLEGDFIQYSETSQNNPLSFEELGRLTEEITCAIKSAQPNAVVAMNHTTWNGDDETDDFWAAMPLEILDMVWTTGVGDNDGYVSESGGPNEYNARTARYDYISNLTGRKIFVDESFGASRMADTWLNQSASTINERISEGVIAVNLTGTGLPGNVQQALSNLSSSLTSTCQ